MQTFPNPDLWVVVSGLGEREFEVCGFHSVAVGQQVGHQIAPDQRGQFRTDDVVINRHFGIGAVIGGGVAAVKVGVLADWVLVVQRAVSVLQSEFIAVIPQVGALKAGDEETGLHPFSVVVVAVHGGHSPEVHVANRQRV